MRDATSTRCHRLHPTLIGCALGASLALATGYARAQTASPPPDRSSSWGQATTILAVSSAALQLVSPRIFYADPEVTAGWKARWHVSAFAPVMTLATLSFWNEHHLKNSFEGKRPGCDDTNAAAAECQTFGMLSTPSFLAFAALGQGTGVFLADTLKWSNGEFNGGAFALEVGVPLVLGTITAIGRTSGNWESAGQVWGSAGIGVVTGLGVGLVYGLLQRPECGYTGNLICW